MNFFNKVFASKSFYVSLRIKIMLVFILPMTLILSLLFYIHNNRERKELESMVTLNAIQMANVTLGSLSHAMSLNDKAMINDVIEDVGKDSSVKEVWIVGADSTVFVSTEPSKVGEKLDIKKAGCVECHQYSPQERPRAMHVWVGEGVLRVSTPVSNKPECYACHPKSQQHLGVFLIDLSTADIEKDLQKDVMYNTVFSVVSILSLMLLAYLLIQWLIVRRVDVIHSALIQLTRRDFSTRINARWHTRDEITQLADHINEMAASFEVLQIEHDQKEKVRAQAIVYERERIARELHDGVAQFLGYLSTKIGATLIALRNHKENVAEKNLEQVEQSIRDQSVEVRSAIIGLKMAGAVDRGFSFNVREFIDQCNRLNDLALELEITSAAEKLNMGAEKELQMFRILQEAVSNIRKHSMSSEASVHLDNVRGHLVMIISDNGVGFDPVKTGVELGNHFGLRIMFERAHEIGAHIEIKSNSTSGTQVIVTLAV